MVGGFRVVVEWIRGGRGVWDVMLWVINWYFCEIRIKIGIFFKGFLLLDYVYLYVIL